VILVFNASPVIVLAKAGLLEAFVALGNPAVIPQAALDEVLNVEDPKDQARVWFEQKGSLMQVVPTPPISSFLAGWDLGAGESAVISSVVSQPGSVAVLDDFAARRCALAHGIQMTGTLGLVLLAKKRGLIAEVGSALDAIVAAGLYISPKHLADVRAKAGE
jgi:predicted nucleic acid-binding protein